ncbi:MAG: LruC domain-containing protein [Calditrichaeota bacterium]|nr:MAG: LruC domain-containing protein [Calditrichota bacterium]
MPKSKNLLTKATLLMVSSLALFSCTNDDTEEVISNTQLEEAAIDDSFSYNTLKEFDLKVTVLDSESKPAKFVKVKVFDTGANNPDALANINAIASGVTDANGVFSTHVTTPTFMEKLVVQAGIIGVVNSQQITLNQENIDITIGGEVLPETITDKRANNFIAGTNATYDYIGTYINNVGINGGLPNYLNFDTPTYTLNQGLLDDINASLPEGSPLPSTHPEYIVPSAQTNLALSDSAEVWVSFIHEGAGYRNALGYYTYPNGNPPTNPNDVTKHIVIFPNASYQGAGGQMTSGMRVQLPGVDPLDGSNIFPAGTTVAWFLSADGWNGTDVDDGNWLVYSNENLNPQSDPNDRVQTVLLLDEDRDLLLLSFEDILRPGGDRDFNDAVFFVEASPWTSVDTTGLPPITISDTTDTDGDGCRDDVDDYPNDATKCSNNYFPSRTVYGSLAYEDLWNKQGDYDFNDLTMGYRINQITDADNNVTYIEGDFVVKAIGAAYHNGFGFELPITPGAVSSVTGHSILNTNLVDLAANGVENGQTNAVIVVTDDVSALTPASGFINTVDGDAFTFIDTLNISIALSSPVSPATLGAPPYNPFLISNSTRGREVHLADMEPTDLADLSLLGQGDDDSNAGIGRYYKTSNNLPWGLLLPGEWGHPIEKNAINLAYPNFIPWAVSGGVANLDWYLRTIPNNVNETYIWEPTP